MNAMCTVYVIYYDMEIDVPDVITLDEMLANYIRSLNPASDYVKVEMSVDDFMSMAYRVVNKLGNS